MLRRPRPSIGGAVAVVAAVAVVVAVAAVLVARPRAGDADDAGAAHLGPQLILDSPGLTLRSSSLPAGPPAQQPAGTPGVVFASPSSSLGAGPLLALLDTDTAAERGFRSTPVATGMTPQQIAAFERATTFENGVATVADSAVLQGLQPAGDVSTLLGLVAMAGPFGSPTPASAPFGAATAQVTGVQYSLATGDTITLSSMPAPAADVGLMVGLLLDDEQALTVAGAPAVIGDLAADVGQRPGLRMLVWQQGGRLLALVGPARTDLLELAGTVRPANGEEWSAVEDARYDGAAFATPPVGSAPAVSVGNAAEP